MAELDEAVHRKRLAQILRYIANMHHALLHDAEGEGMFVRRTVRRGGGGGGDDACSSFFQRETADGDGQAGVLFSTEDFRQLLSMQQQSEEAPFESPPFAFYAASQSLSAARKRGFTGQPKRTLSVEPQKACWLRLTRLTNAQVSSAPSSSHAEVRRYLEDWLAKTPNVPTLQRLLTLRRLGRAPKVSPTVSVRGNHAIKSFLKKYKRYLEQQSYQKLLEPIYNSLFEWVQSQQDHHYELVWGLGRAVIRADDALVNGPLLEILVEVELARDGALLIRPREHTGVALNREVVAAVSSSGSAAGHSVLTELHKTVSELEPANMSPGQPNTYIPVLKRLAVQLSPGGTFRASSTSSAGGDDSHLRVTEEWCLYARPKPSSVWARDALAFADQLLQPDSSLEVPVAAWSLTHGPGTLDAVLKKGSRRDFSNFGLMDLLNAGLFYAKKAEEPASPPLTKPLFPLPTSDAQSKIAELLLQANAPAVVCEGGPGTGKTHCIANLICAYLCQGKRVLVTSKNAPALSVLRNRLPPSVRELCVDVSMSELQGMRQLQQTVERLANRIASVNVDMETEKHLYLQRSITEHEKEIIDLNEKLSQFSEKIRQTVIKHDGQTLVELTIPLIEAVPWLMKTTASWTPLEVSKLAERVKSLVLLENDPINDVTGFDWPLPAPVVSLVASNAGEALSVVANAAKTAVASVPLLRSLSGMEHHLSSIQDDVDKIKINGNTPQTKSDWETVLRAVKHAQSVSSFQEEVWNKYQRFDAWPERDFAANNDHAREFGETLQKLVVVKELGWKLDVADQIKTAVECRSLDARRKILAGRIQALAEELVDATVLAGLSRTFSTDAQSALIRFAQIAGKAKFSKASQPSKMSQRQRRRRQEYLDAFDRCCRFIPCWILTTSQISDYLPSECLFDLVITDESSQSDVTVLPGMLRGRQWLIVGDGKQVSPTECFVSEEQIDNLRAALPSSPLQNSFLPGQSFFDLCAQGFPNGRVVLDEHFRCAPEIIAFSNREFYNDRLVPLRLPLKSERLKPSVLDVRVHGGVKVGKVNEKEADEIVRRVRDIVSHPSSSLAPRSIGVISLMGDEQSRLIRGRLLDRIGPHHMARHDVMVGDAPTFQGAERDIIFLSMVCSPGSAPTQNQLMHFQRANVALSRARDQCVLVRSLDLSDVPSGEDIKIPIMEFFDTGVNDDDDGEEAIDPAVLRQRQPAIRRLLMKLLKERGYTVRSMGIVWKNGLSVEHPSSDARAAVMVDCAEDSLHDWHASYKKQKAIERVGWQCLRVDALSLLNDFSGTLDSIVRFLSGVGIEDPAVVTDIQEDGSESSERENDAEESRAGEQAGIEELEEENEPVGEAAAEDVMVISSDEEADKKPAAKKPDSATTESLEREESDEQEAAQFGEVVGLDFLRVNSRSETQDEEEEGNEGNEDRNDSQSVENEEKVVARANSLKGEMEDVEGSRSKRRRKYRRLEKYQRDGRWYPGKTENEDSDEQEWYDDTDSDLAQGDDDDESYKEEGGEVKGGDSPRSEL